MTRANETVDALWEDGLEGVDTGAFDDVDEGARVKDDLRMWRELVSFEYWLLVG